MGEEGSLTLGMRGVSEQGFPEDDRTWITHLHRPGCPESKHQVEGMREEGKVPASSGS